MFKLINETRFILELMTELTLSQRKQYSIQIYYRGVFMKVANAECVQSKTYRVLTPVLLATKKFEQKTVQKYFKAMYGNINNF